MYPPEVFVQMANASWDINESAENNTQMDTSLNFMRQMAAVYNPQSYTKDIDKTYQLCLGKEKCILKTDDFKSYNTRIEVDFELWLQISEGKVNGAKVLMEKLYKVLGDIETMLKMDEYFGTKKSIPDVKPKTNMNILLLQWIALWVLLPINKVWAGIAGIVNGAIYSVVFQMVSGKGRKRLN